MKHIYLIGIQTSYISEAIEICELAGYKEIILVDNLNNSSKKEIDGYPVFHLNKINKTNLKINYACPIHTPIFREKTIRTLAASQFKPVTIIHPTAVISMRAKISGKGVIIGANTVVGSHTTVSDFVFINRGALIGHDVRIEKLATIESGAILGGLSHVDKKSYIAMGAKIFPEIKIGKNSIVGAGAVVRSNVPDKSMVAGVPAVVKKTNIQGYRSDNSS